MDRVSRRDFVRGVAGLGAAVLGIPGTARAQGAAPREVKGFLTTADVEKAEKEGALVFYGAEIERQLIDVLQAFSKLFPKIDTSKYLREQTGRLYGKLTAERRAGTYLADVCDLTDIAIARDLQKNGGWARYLSPHVKAYEPRFQSEVPGHFTWCGADVVGIAYNTNLVPAAEAPKNWKDLLDPKWRGLLNLKDSASGWQGIQWLLFRKMYGERFWKDMADQKPRGLASVTQQYERLISGEDKVNGIAQFSVYLKNKEKGAPIGFVFPPDGVVVGPTVTGIVDRAPHPEAAKLFVDWLLSPVGQVAYVKANYYYSLRKDVAAPPGGRPIAEMKVLVPDWDESSATHGQYVKEWNALVGLR